MALHTQLISVQSNMSTLFDVIYSGQLLPNANGDDVVQQFALLFKIPQETAHDIVLGNKEFVIKRKIDSAVAQRYKEKLSHIGMLIHLREDSSTGSSDTKVVPMLYGPVEKGEADQIAYQHYASSHNPYQSPKSDLSSRPGIDELDVSEKWKNKFRLIEAAGGPSLPYLKELTFGERMQIMGNILSYIFWPIYLPIKGLWRPALCYFVLGVALGILIDMAGFERVSRAIGYGISALVMFRTNVNYYRHKVLGEKFWF